jgi:hypothetical protein
MPPPPPLEALEEADAVFSARCLTAVPIEHTNGYTHTYTLRVLAVWKGEGDAIITIRTSDPAMCGIWLNPGEEYLIYAYEWEGVLESNNCSRTKMLEFAAEDLAELGEPNIVVGNREPSWGTIKARY